MAEIMIIVTCVVDLLCAYKEWEEERRRKTKREFENGGKKFKSEKDTRERYLFARGRQADFNSSLSSKSVVLPKGGSESWGEAKS